MNTTSQISLAHLRRRKQARFNPLSTVTNPTDVGKKLDAFEAVYLKDIATIWDALEQRDDLIRAVVAKRKKAVGRQGWTVLTKESIPADRQPEAEAHAAALEYFNQNLRCENALDRAEQCGLARQGSSRLAVQSSKLLCRQMMDAVGKRFAVHEIVWKPAAQGGAGVSPAEFGVPPNAHGERSRKR